MNIPGTEQEYKKELKTSLQEGYEISKFSANRFDEVYERNVEGHVFSKTIYVGLVDDRSITPESLDDARTSLENLISESRTRTFLGSIGHGKHIIVVGVTDTVSSDTRSHIKKPDKDMTELGKFIQEMAVVDVSAGAIVVNESRRHGLSELRDLMQNHLEKPLN